MQKNFTFHTHKQPEKSASKERRLCGKSSFLLFFGLWIVSGCAGWHVADSMSSERASVSIPYAQGDSTGDFTSRLIGAVNEQPGFFVDESGRYILSVVLLDHKEQRIGYRYDPLELDKGRKKIIPNENRGKELAEVKLIDRFTNQVVGGPAFILGSAEYDHQENTIDRNTNRLSLGQLSDIDAEHDVVSEPLYQDLARKISVWLQTQQDLLSLKSKSTS